MDFFTGSATTIAVAHKLGRRWIGVEMGEQFNTIALPRMKEVLAGSGNHEPTGISKDVKWEGGGFFKYFSVEQYEDILRLVKYEDSDLFSNPEVDPYTQYVFLRDKKLLSAVEVNLKTPKVKIDLSRLYGGIDIPESISSFTGRRIKRITSHSVEFTDGATLDTSNPEFRFIKPFIWW